MAISVPVYREQQVKQQAISGQKQQIDAPSAAFGSLQAQQLIQSGTALGRLSEQWNRRAINIQDEANELTALKMETDIENEMTDFLYNPQSGLLTKKGQNALTAPNEIKTKVNSLRKRLDDDKTMNPDVRGMLDKSFIGIQRRYGDVASRHQFQEYMRFKDETLNSRLESNMNDVALNYLDDKEFQVKADESFKVLEAKALSNGWDDKTLSNEKRKAYALMRGTQIQALIATDEPQNIVIAKKVYDEARKRGQINDFDTALRIENQLRAAVPKAAAHLAYSSGRAAITDQEAIIDFVIDQQEGGDTLAQEPNGAVARYGINSAAFPSADVQNMTRAGAVDIYKKEFWGRYGIDDLPDNMKMIAFDSVVNHRSDFAKDVVKAISNGATPDEILNMRLKEYQRLAESPEYAAYYDGWVNRLQRLKTMTGAEHDSKSVYSTAAELEKTYKGSGQELISLYETDMKNREAQKKNQFNEVQDQVQQIVSENNGDYTKVPASLRAQAASLGIDITAYKGTSDPDVIAELDAMPSSQFFSLDLNDKKYSQSLNFKDKQEYLKKQGDLQKPDNKYTSEMIDGVVNYYFRAQKGADPDNKVNKAKVAGMKNYVAYKARSYLEAGKKPERAEINKWASEYLALKKQVGGNENMDVSDIPDDIRAIIEQGLIDANKDVNETAVVAAFLKMKQAGFIK
jgi:lysozyme family protein